MLPSCRIRLRSVTARELRLHWLKPRVLALCANSTVSLFYTTYSTTVSEGSVALGNCYGPKRLLVVIGASFLLSNFAYFGTHGNITVVFHRRRTVALGYGYDPEPLLASASHVLTVIACCSANYRNEPRYTVGAAVQNLHISR